MHFVQLTLRDGEKTYVNMHLVTEMRESGSARTRLYIAMGEEGDVVDVQETCEEILKKL